MNVYLSAQTPLSRFWYTFMRRRTMDITLCVRFFVCMSINARVSHESNIMHFVNCYR